MKTILLAVAAGALITGTSFAQDTVQQTSLATTLAVDIAQAAVWGVCRRRLQRVGSRD
ncbi:hypothetical protein J2W42_004129 [Rhizobium tibeticum]|uniref:hypothetical protein n=1 Tax=Rhizobium tibeticum TaxID=501024 RepID=UPI00278053B6|nr:hypothetical protein [Rhizobium tibeticum]MDP9811266.1 hypothetical protein [Rhizobium tibeticum]